MNDIESFLAAIREILVGLRDGKLSDQEFVDRYDVLMADHLPDGLDQSGTTYRLLDDYHMQFAFFQRDPAIRGKGPDDLYGPEELRQKSQSLLDALDRL